MNAPLQALPGKTLRRTGTLGMAVTVQTDAPTPTCHRSSNATEAGARKKGSAIAPWRHAVAQRRLGRARLSARQLAQVVCLSATRRWIKRTPVHMFTYLPVI